MHFRRLAHGPKGWVILALVAVGAASSMAPAQVPSANSIQELRQRLMSGAGTAVVHVSNLHGTTRVLVHPVDNFVANGAVQGRPLVGLLRGADEVIKAGQTVRILEVEATQGKRNDVLRVTVSTPGNAVAPVAFLLAPGAAQSMTEAQMEALVFPVLTPVGASPTASWSESATRGRGTQPPAPPGWVVRRTPAGTEALLRGTTEGAGHTAPAILVLGCPAVALSRDRPALMPYVELRVPKASVSFDTAIVGEKDGDDNGYVHLQISTSPELKVDLATWTSIPESGNVAPLGLDLRSREIEQVADASAEPLRVAVLPEAGKPEGGVNADFSLPGDITSEQAAMAPCIQKMKAAEEALHASRAVECPEVPSQVLINADVWRASSGKPLPVNPERDQGVGWTLPTVTKAHPVVAKSILVCSYGPPDQKAEATKRSTTVKTLPIPPGAGLCEAWIRTTEIRSEAYCTGMPR